MELALNERNLKNYMLELGEFLCYSLIISSITNNFLTRNLQRSYA